MYDPMILNMVSERYPRDEDYASDSDLVIGEDCDSDFSDEVPSWLFADLEEEDSLPQENDNFNIVFGSFGKHSDLDVGSAIFLNPIKPKTEGSNIKIGQIICSLNTVKPQTKISCDALLSDPEVKDENNSEKNFTGEDKSEKISSDLGSEITNHSKKMLRLPNRLLNLKKFLPASPYSDRSSHTQFVFIAPDLIYHSRFKFRKLASSSIDVPSPDKIVECVDLAFGCKLDYESVKKPPDLDDEEEEVAPPRQIIEEDEVLFVDLCNMISSPEALWELLRRRPQHHDPDDVREASGLILLVAFCTLLYALLSWTGLTLSLNIGTLHFRPSLFELGRGLRDSLVTPAYWAISLGLG